MKTLLFILLLLCVPCVTAQTETPGTCTTNRNAPPVGAWYWPADTVVKVHFVRDKFTAEQKDALFTAMDTWTRAAKSVGAGVTFVYAGETTTVNACRNCLTVTRSEVFKYDRKHYAFFYPIQRTSDGALISAWIDLDNATTDTQALKAFMAHEMGHSLGLWDCTSCKKKQTIMNGFPGINKPNGLIAASTCDLEVVRQVYQGQRRIAGTADRAEGASLAKRN